LAFGVRRSAFPLTRGSGKKNLYDFFVFLCAHARTLRIARARIATRSVAGWGCGRAFCGYSCPFRLSFETDGGDSICGNWDKPGKVRTILM